MTILNAESYANHAAPLRGCDLPCAPISAIEMQPTADQAEPPSGYNAAEHQAFFHNLDMVRQRDYEHAAQMAAFDGEVRPVGNFSAVELASLTDQGSLPDALPPATAVKPQGASAALEFDRRLEAARRGEWPPREPEPAAGAAPANKMPWSEVLEHMRRTGEINTFSLLER